MAQIIAFAGGFHGRTLLSAAMTGKVSPYKKGLGPFPSEIYHVPLPSETTGVSLDETVKALNFLFAADIEPERIAAIILEPVQGEGGFHVPGPGLYGIIDELRRKHGIMLIADEVQTGFARTVRMFGIEHAPLKLDLITVANPWLGASLFPASSDVPR